MKLVEWPQEVSTDMKANILRDVVNEVIQKQKDIEQNQEIIASWFADKDKRGRTGKRANEASK